MTSCQAHCLWRQAHRFPQLPYLTYDICISMDSDKWVEQNYIIYKSNKSKLMPLPPKIHQVISHRQARCLQQWAHLFLFYSHFNATYIYELNRIDNWSLNMTAVNWDTRVGPLPLFSSAVDLSLALQWTHTSINIEGDLNLRNTLVQVGCQPNWSFQEACCLVQVHAHAGRSLLR